MSACVPCRTVETAVRRYGRVDRNRLPEWLRDPSSEYELTVAFAVAAWSRGISPVCRGGVVTGFTGPGLDPLVKQARAILN